MKEPQRFNALANNNLRVPINKRRSPGNWNIQTVPHTQPYKLLPSCAVWGWNGQQGRHQLRALDEGLRHLVSDCQQEITSTESLVHTVLLTALYLTSSTPAYLWA